MAQNMLFWSTLLKFARLSDLETLKQTPWSQQERFLQLGAVWNSSGIKSLLFFEDLTR